jgi:hypothetical protein
VAILGLNAGEEPLQLLDLGFVTLIEGPLLDPLAAYQTCLREHLEMFTHSWLAESQLLGDEHTTDTIANKVSIYLRRKVRAWLLEPLEDQEPAVIPQCPKDADVRHIANLLIPVY